MADASRGTHAERCHARRTRTFDPVLIRLPWEAFSRDDSPAEKRKLRTLEESQNTSHNLLLGTCQSLWLRNRSHGCGPCQLVEAFRARRSARLNKGTRTPRGTMGPQARSMNRTRDGVRPFAQGAAEPGAPSEARRTLAEAENPAATPGKPTCVARPTPSASQRSCAWHKESNSEIEPTSVDYYPGWLR